MVRRSLARCLVLALLLGVVGVGCDGQIGAKSNGPQGASPPAVGAAPGGATFQLAPVSMRRLTLAEYRNSVADLLGGPVSLPSDLEGVSRTTYEFTTVGSGQAVYSGAAIEEYQSAAAAAVTDVFGDAQRKKTLLGACAAAQHATDACVATFLSQFGRRAFRRPLTADELARYQGVVTAVAAQYDVMEALSEVTAGFLSSPNFLFRSELGTPAGDKPGALAFHSFELASRLSFLLWQTGPDDALLDAAATGALDTTDGFEAQLTRLLADPRAQAAFINFFSEDFALDILDTLVKDPTAFPNFTPTMGASMRGELEHVLADLVFTQDADIRTLFTTRKTFVNAEIASLYGLPAPTSDDFVQVDFPSDGDRAGLFAFSGILASQSHATVTSPTERGKFLRERILGQLIPPPANAVGTFPQGDNGGPHRTMRDRLAVHAVDPACAGCHKMMDPPGLGLEHFDALGQYRADDEGLALDTSETLDGQSFDGPAQLGQLVAQDPRVTHTFVRALYRYAVGHVDTVGEAPLLDGLHADFASNGYRSLSLLKAILRSDGFRYAAPNP